MENIFKEFVIERLNGDLTPLGEQVLQELNLEMEVDYVEEVMDVHNGKKFFSDVWDVELFRGEKSLELHYMQGEGWKKEEPKIQDVLYCILSDYFGYKQSFDFEDYCANYGTDIEEDEDRARAETVYKKVAEQAEELEGMFTEDELKFLSKVYQDY